MLLPIPPQKPVPNTLIVTGVKFDPMFGLRLLTAGKAVVTMYLSETDVELVPPAAITVMS